jgi:uncharacterized protein YecT (DUF1311 family)
MSTQGRKTSRFGQGSFGVVVEFTPPFFSLNMKELSVSMKTCNKILTPILATMFLFVFMARDLSASERDCKDAVSTAEMRTCANELYEAADAELNRVYRQLASQLSDERREKLKAAQQAWIAFRDKNATFAASVVEGGTMYPILEVTELTSMTKQRTEQLRAYLK